MSRRADVPVWVREVGGSNPLAPTQTSSNAWAPPICCERQAARRFYEVGWILRDSSPRPEIQPRQIPDGGPDERRQAVPVGDKFE
jgi:hypothetical protein